MINLAKCTPEQLLLLRIFAPSLHARIQAELDRRSRATARRRPQPHRHTTHRAAAA